MKTFIACFAVCAALLRAQDYSLGPDSQPRDGVPKGVVTKHRLEPGRFYPGTPHNYSIYVPAQYSASKPAPFMIFMDGSGSLGNGQRVPIVFDNLIAKGELPPMIGIFIDPGVLPALSDSAQSRYERTYEYDNISPRFSQFLIDELIPEVGKQYNLSKDPNDRGLAGVSTGAVGAFVAAWERPDQFRRVLSFIGTYVGMRGADTLPDLIRRSEPKPLRVFLQDGKNDHIAAGQPYGVFYGGSWPMANQVMFEALQFQGYDVKLTIGEGGHDMRQGSAMMPDALRWLWREYPKPIVPREPAALDQAGWEPRGQVFSIISVNQPWEQVGGAYRSAGSPVADRDGNVYFADPVAGRIYKQEAVFKENTGGVKVIRMGADGRLYAAQPTTKKIVSYGPGSDEKTAAQGVEASDMALTAKGEIYYTDTAHKTVGFIDAKGQKRVVYSGGEMAKPVALTLSPDQSMVVVADGESRFSWSFQIAKDGGLINGEPFYRVDMPEVSPVSGVASVTEDSTGQVYFATAMGIQYCEQNGRCTGILSKPERGPVTGIAFGGKDLGWLYAAEGNKLFRRQVKVRGVWPGTLVKPPKPAL